MAVPDPISARTGRQLTENREKTGAAPGSRHPDGNAGSLPLIFLQL